MTEFLLYLYAESPIHAGGAGSVDVVSLPVQREATTTYPVIWGQSLKGALRQAAGDFPGEAWDDARVARVFGSAVAAPDEEGGTTPGLLQVGDAQLVAMPAPTLRRTFAWVTSDIALGRLSRKYAALGGTPPPRVPRVPTDGAAAASAAWTESAEEAVGPYVVSLGDGGDEELGAWARRLAGDALPGGEEFRPFSDKLGDDLLLAGSDLMPTLLRECTEQPPRVQLGENKTVANGPFHSEYLPAETILAASLTLRGDTDTPGDQAAMRELLDGKLLQVGGDETLGKGLARGRLLERETAEGTGGTS